MFVQIGTQTSDTTDDLQSYGTPGGTPGGRDTAGTARASIIPAEAQTRPSRAIGTAFDHAVPGIAVLAMLLAGVILLLAALRRVPRDYPLRGVAVVFTALATVGLGVLVAVRVGPATTSIVTGQRAVYTTFRTQQAASRPIEPLDAYVPLYPCATPPILAPSTTRWEATTGAPVPAVAAFYKVHHAGWKVEMSAGSGVVLMRRTSDGEERLRIQAFAGSPTRIEYELRRRIS
jgi:hypothetical protein